MLRSCIDSEPEKPLEADPRVTVVPLSGFDWDTYSIIEERGLLNDVETVPWDGGSAFSVRVLVPAMRSLGLTYRSAPTAPLHQPYPTFHQRGTTYCSTLSMYTGEVVAFQVWPCTHEFHSW